MVIRSSSIIPEMRCAYFSCTTCGYHTQVEIDRGRIVEPTVCALCNVSHSFELIHNRSFFADKQLIKLQEIPGNRTDCVTRQIDAHRITSEEMPAGQTPITVTVVAHNDLVDAVQPGDRYVSDRSTIPSGFNLHLESK